MLEEQKECFAHGDIFLPVNSYHCVVPYSYTELAPHWHEEMEITLIREGCSLYRVYPEYFQAEEGDLLLVPPHCLHSASEIAGRTMTSDSLVFHLDFLGAAGQDLSASRYLRPLYKGQLWVAARVCPGQDGYGEIQQAFLDALDCFLQKPICYELKLREKMLHLLVLLFEHGYIRQEALKGQMENRQQLNEILQYMNGHYREKIPVGQLADMAGFSESYFMYYFKKNVGMTCVEYMNQYRLSQAAQMLESTNLPVIEIAMEQGFENISYFNRLFRKRFGIPPRRFRTHRK